MKNENLTDNGECDITGNTLPPSVRQVLDDTTKEKISGIYKIINKVNGKYYVGGAKNIISRWREHKYDLCKNIHHNDYLQKSWNKYGSETFDFVIVEKCDITQVKLTEQKYLDIANNEKDKSYNLSFTAEGGDFTEITKQKISISLKKYYSNNPEMKKHLSKIHSGVKQTLEHIQNAANAKKGKNHYLYGKHHSLETKSKLSGTNHPRYNNTIYTFHNTLSNETFVGTQNDFYKKYNFLRQNVYSLVKGTRKSYLKWKCLTHPG